MLLILTGSTGAEKIVLLDCYQLVLVKSDRGKCPGSLIADTTDLKGRAENAVVPQFTQKAGFAQVEVEIIGGPQHILAAALIVS